MSHEGIRIEQKPLRQLILAKHPRNARKHAMDAIQYSLSEYGYIEPIVYNERTNRILSGHGRVKALQGLRDNGQPAPPPIVQDSKDWLVPVVVVDVPAERESEILIALNRTAELGGWSEKKLLPLLREFAARKTDYLEYMQFQSERVDALLQRSHTQEPAGATDDPNAPLTPTASKARLNPIYTQALSRLYYTPQQEQPPAVSELYDDTEYQRLIQIIEQAGVPEPLATMLRYSAARFVRLDFDAIAEYYCHSPAPIQALFEELALVIIDADRALERGLARFFGDVYRYFIQEHDDDKD